MGRGDKAWRAAWRNSAQYCDSCGYWCSGQRTGSNNTYIVVLPDAKDAYIVALTLVHTLCRTNSAGNILVLVD